MREIHPRLWVGSLADCGMPGICTVHACKSPCHANKCSRNVSKDDPNYLTYEEGDNLYLNIIDPPKPLFRYELFARFLAWVEPRYRAGERILIHCNKGESRAPSLALLLLAKLGEIPTSSYALASDAYAALVGGYSPGKGIEVWLRDHWKKFDFEPEKPKEEPPPQPVPEVKEFRSKVSQWARANVGALAEERALNGGYTDAELDEIADDPEMWGLLHGKIPHRVSQEPVPLVPSPLQRRLFAHYRRCQQRGEPFRVVMCKIRRGGGSTGMEAILYVHAHNYRARLGCIGTTHTVSMNMFDMVSFFNKHDDFPGWKRASKELQIGEMEWDNGSSWEKYTADNSEAARSAGLQGYHATEAGRWQDGGANDARETLKSMQGAVPKHGFTVIGEESTAQGAHGAFHERWCNARWPEYADWWRKWEDETQQNLKEIGAQSQFVRIFAAWFEDDENRDTSLTEAQVRLMQNRLDEKERTLIARYRTVGPQGERLGLEVTVATLWEQLAWRRTVIDSEFEGDVEGFEQEYPSSPKEAFASSGRHTFNTTGCAWMLTQAKMRPPEYGILTETFDGRIVFNRTEDSDAWIAVWEEPREGYRYVNGTDTMSGEEQTAGSKIHDYHFSGIVRAAHVDDHGKKNPHKIVAELMDKSMVEPDVLAKQVDLMSRWYGRCLVAPEVNNTGYAFLTHAKTLGMNIYRREKLDRHTSEVTELLGWLTDDKTRPPLISSLQALIRYNAKEETRCDGIEGGSVTTAIQLSTMVKDAKGKDAAAPRCHDDNVMGLGIAIQCINGATYFPGHKRKRKQPPDRGSWKKFSR